MYKVIFCGTPEIAVAILKSLEELNLQIVAIITQPDKLQNRKKEIIYPPVKEYGLTKNYKILQPLKINDMYDEIKDLKADFLITCAFGQFIPQNILDFFKNSINIHTSLLPKYRGGSPVQHALINGDTQTGISFMKMVKRMDAGEVYIQRAIDIDSNDNAGSLFIKITKLAQSMIKKYLIDILDGKIQGKEQNEKEVTFAYNLTNEQEEIDWNKSATEVHNFIRALSPKPGAFTFLKQERIKIKTTRIIKDDEIFIVPQIALIPGMIVNLDKEGIIVSTKVGFIKILELQREGKKPVSAGTFNFPNSPFKIISIFTKFPQQIN